MFGIEVAHRGDFTVGALQRLLGEEVAGFGTQLAADDILIDAVVTVDDYVVDICLRTLLNAHLQIHGVAHDVRLARVELVEYVTIVIIEVTDGILVILGALVNQLLVIDIALLHAEVVVQHIRGIERVTNPLDVTDVIALTLVHGDVDIHAVVLAGDD